MPLEIARALQGRETKELAKRAPGKFQRWPECAPAELPTLRANPPKLCPMVGAILMECGTDGLVERGLGDGETRSVPSGSRKPPSTLTKACLMARATLIPNRDTTELRQIWIAWTMLPVGPVEWRPT